jgi:hypothetical protein
MLTLRTIIGNIKKGQSALKVRDILHNLEISYQKIKVDIKVVGCKKEETKCTVFLTCPSETNNKVRYDIVYELHDVDRLTLDTKFKVYSNSPAFGYNFSYVFNKLGSLLWPEKYPKEFREMSPKIRNPFYFVGFDKHVYSTVKYIADYTLSRIIEELDGTVPPVKIFNDKQQEIRDINEEIRRSHE